MVTARCSECDKRMDRCKPVLRLPSGKVIYTCPRCWKTLEYDQFMKG